MNNHTNIEFKKFLIYLIKTKKYDSMCRESTMSIALTYRNNGIFKHIIFNATKNTVVDIRFYDKSNKESIIIPVFKNIFYYFNILNIKLNSVIIKELENLKNEKIKNDELNELNIIYSQMTIEYKQLINK